MEHEPQQNVSTLPPHGRVTCSQCFDGLATWNVTQRETTDGWHIINNPMSWGSKTPQFLVLGVSKGTTQCEAVNAKPHDRIPFDGFRPKLTDALRLLGMLSEVETVDLKIRSDESDWAFGSMVRCALGLVDTEDSSISRSGTVIQRLAQMDEDSSWLTRCSTAFLSRLPDRLKVCILLSNDDKYIEACRRAITRLRPTTRSINSVAYGDEQIIWVHIIHVGGPGKNHIKNWFAGEGTQGQKRIEAQNAVSKALGRPIMPIFEMTSEKSPKFERMQLASKGRAKKRVATGEGRPIPDNATREAILARIAAREDIEQHRDQAQLHGTKYISAFATRRGVAFAVDKMSASKQPIWFLDSAQFRSDLDGAGITYELYSPDDGRNHNLYKLPGFKYGALIRAYPDTVDQALNIADILCSGPN